MRGFLVGLLVGAGIVAILLWPRDERARAEGASRELVESVRPPPRGQPPEAEADDARADPPPAFAPGVVILRIGEGFVFGESAVRRGADEACDIVCQDIRHGASIHAPRGSTEAALPLGAVGVPERAADLAALLADAPEQLAEHDLMLTAGPRGPKLGIGFVRGGDGDTYRIHLQELHAAVHALQRFVELRYEAVPVRSGGGVVRTATASGSASITDKDLRSMVAIGAALPGDSFSSQLVGRFRLLEGDEPRIDLKERAYLYAPRAFDRWIRFKGRGALFAAEGIGPEGHVVLASYSAVAAVGEMAGTVDVKSYSYVHITGDLTGTVNIGSYATVVIEGDIRGTLNVKSYTDLLLRGRVLGKLVAKGSCWSDFYFESFHDRRELEALGTDGRSVTLHLKESDLASGEHEKIGGWRKVIVGGEAWKKIPPRR